MSITAAALNLFIAPASAADKENEDTYSINLVQTAEVAKEIVKLDNDKILTESYVARDGDHIWKILRNKNLLKKNNLGEILSALKKLNPSLSNIDLIHPGEKIIIPLVITPITNEEKPGKIARAEAIPLEDIKNLEYYTLRPGDSIIRVINKKYSIPEKDLYNEYLDQIKKLNPDIKDLNNVSPGQKVRLPIYSPKVVRGTIEKSPQKPDNEALRQINKEKGDHLKKIFTLIGEEWVDQGKQFIPLKTGGQIDLNAETYPIINIRNGEKVIVDLFNNLPDRMAELIRSSWAYYHIVHITENDDLTGAVGKVISACGYDRVYTKDESLVLEEGFKIEITADWIIRLLPDASKTDQNIVCLNLTGKDTAAFPSPLKNFLMSHGVKLIDYPEPNEGKDIPPNSNAVSLDESINNVIEKILALVDQNYSGGLDIPVYKKEDSDFNLVIKADYFFKRKGKDCIIDLKGVGDDIISLLKDHGFSVLSLAGEQNLYKLTEKILDFLGIQFDNNEHTFYALPKGSNGNVKLVIPGILFNDYNGQSVLFSSIYLNPEICRFLSTKVDNIFFFSRSPEAERNGRQNTGN